jgi:hypothetical protein
MAALLPSPFGVAWDELELGHVLAFLARGTDESLTWEAKGGRIRPEHVREAVSAFANSPVGGILVLGVTRDPATRSWAPDVWIPPNAEVATSIDDTIGRGGVSPLPSAETKAWALPAGGVLACVAVWPASMPPVMTSDGQVYVRTSGKSMKVTDVGDLRRLFERGAAAEARAVQRSSEASAELNAIEVTRGAPAVVLGFASPSLPEEVAAVAFRQSFVRASVDEAVALHRSVTADGLRNHVAAAADWNQAGFTARTRDGFDNSEAYSIRVGRDGRVAVAFGSPDLSGASRPPTDIDRLLPMWSAGSRVLKRLGAVGPIHVTASFPSRIGAITSAVWSDVTSSGRAEIDTISRDVIRAVGQAAWEPERDAET